MHPQHARHRRSRPQTDGLPALAKALGVRSELRVLRRLGGGLASATHLIAIDDNRKVVVKRYPAASEVPPLEWEALCFAHDAGLPAPRPLALDTDGHWFGTPAIAMDAVTGRANLAPGDLDRYVAEGARALAKVHAASTDRAAGALRRTHSVDQWVAPDVAAPGLLTRALAERVLDTVVPSLLTVPRGTSVLNHSDFHPGNLLWHRGRLSAVVDWAAARVGIRWWEVAYFRMEVAVLASLPAADAFLRAYEDLVGERSEHQWFWDLLCLYNGHRWGHLWLTGYQEQGRRDLTIPEMRRRLGAVTRGVLRDRSG